MNDTFRMRLQSVTQTIENADTHLHHLVHKQDGDFFPFAVGVLTFFFESCAEDTAFTEEDRALFRRMEQALRNGK